MYKKQKIKILEFKIKRDTVFHLLVGTLPEVQEKLGSPISLISKLCRRLKKEGVPFNATSTRCMRYKIRIRTVGIDVFTSDTDSLQPLIESIIYYAIERKEDWYNRDLYQIIGWRLPPYEIRGVITVETETKE